MDGFAVLGLRRLAGYYMQQERQAITPCRRPPWCTRLIFRLIDQHGVQWKNRSQFLGVAATCVMRRVLLDYSRGYQAAKRGGNVEKVFLQEAAITPKTRPADIVALDAAMTKYGQVGSPARSFG